MPKKFRVLATINPGFIPLRAAKHDRLVDRVAASRSGRSVVGKRIPASRRFI